MTGDTTLIAVDTGGTFTDVVFLSEGRLHALKVPSTPDDPARAVLEGIARALGGAEPDSPGRPDHAPGNPADAVNRRRSAIRDPRSAGKAGAVGHRSSVVGRFTLVHGSTVATNALLERRGARIALVTNAGFEDVIEIGRQNRPQLYALVGHRPPPLVDAGDRHGIAGRLGPDGAEESPLEVSELEGLPGRIGHVEAVAVCLLHSYADPAHEAEVAGRLRAAGYTVSVSSELLPEYREYERTATTVVNAYIAPRMDRYLGRLEAESGADRIRIMGSGGGATPVARARREPVRTVLSGPAGGVMGALDVAADAGVRDIITFDMGGTSTDVSLCTGEPLHTTEFRIADLPVAIPVLDIHTVGAGGGSLAWVDAGGALRVGPRSAGADPGPICYGRGGDRVTVTDAHVWLGRLPPAAFLGGAASLDRSAIEGPLRSLADAIGTGAGAAAEGVVAVADTAMEGALRVISVERGHDPADFALVPFGGAAGLHAAELADRLGIRRLLLPPQPGVLSAYGMLVSPVRKEVSRTVLIPEDEASPERMERELAALEEQALAAMAGEGFAEARIRVQRLVDARYRGQSYELRVPAQGWADAFHASHEARYGFAREAPLEAVTLRVRATAPVERPAAQPLPAADTGARTEGAADVVYRGQPVAADLFPRDALRAGHSVQGPAILTEYSATTWLPPGWSGEVLPSGAIRVERG